VIVQVSKVRRAYERVLIQIDFGEQTVRILGISRPVHLGPVWNRGSGFGKDHREESVMYQGRLA
jgi:hypothetical protein